MKKISLLSLAALIAVQFMTIPVEAGTSSELFGYTNAGVIQEAFGEPGDYYYAGDFDGDRLTDIIVATTRVDSNKNVNNDLAWYFMKGTGSGFVDGGQWNTSFGVSVDNYFVMDFNGDWKDDLLISTTRVDSNKEVDGDLAWYLMLSDGTKFIDGGQINSSFGVDGDNYIKMDYNNDERDDLLIYTDRTPYGSYNWYGMLNNGSKFLDSGLLEENYGNSNTEFLPVNYYTYIYNSDNSGSIDIVLGIDKANAGYVGVKVITPPMPYIGYYEPGFSSGIAPFSMDFKATDIYTTILHKIKNIYQTDHVYSETVDEVTLPVIGTLNNEGNYDWKAVFSDQLVQSSYYTLDVVNNFGKPGDIILTGQFDGSYGGDIVIGENVNGKISWKATYSINNTFTDYTQVDRAYTNNAVPTIEPF